mmetsp:Transcript_8271/g.6168  ORF Transcript_8271/g.6168 Transcript_8271/m.6168 type:complete len:86 (+) Transcript_8271:122-379(+)
MQQGVCNLIIDLTFIGLVFGLTGANDAEGRECSEDMVIWLYVYGGVCILSFLFDVSKIVFMGLKTASNKFKLVFDTIMICTLLNF